MSFASLPFVGLVTAGVVLYYLVPKRAQWVVLLLASMVFYLVGGVKSAVWLVLVAGLTWLAGLLLEKQNARPAPDKAAKTAVRRAKKQICAACLVLCFGLLYLMKYWNFTASALPPALGDKLPRWDFVVPLGLSYFIFQSVGYVIDVYRGKLPAQKNPLKYGLFVSFFPQMVQGPISRYDQLAPQLLAERSLDWRDLKFGIQLCLWGYFKKLVIADRAAVLVNAVITENCPYGGAIIASGILFYCIQLYCDFSGGIDITRGVARMFGIDMAENFRRPIFAMSLTEYWRRWHITLGAWMRDYVFYPLSLSKAFGRLSRWARTHIRGTGGKIFATSLATFIVYLIIGIWHGANWNYVLWGCYYGALLLIEKLVLKKVLNRLPGIIQRIYTMFFVVIGWIIFKCEDMAYGISYLKAMFGGFGQGLWNNETLYLLGNYAVLFVLAILGSTMLPKKAAGVVLGGRKRTWAENVIYIAFYAVIFFVSVAYLVDATYNPFLYFRF